MKKIIITIIVISSIAVLSDETGRKINQDTTLIVPGIGAESVAMGHETEKVIHAFKDEPSKTCKLKSKNEIFSTILKIETETRIYTDYIYYFDSKGIVLCSLKNKISAVISFNTNRVTIDSVDLKKGVQNFIFNYGNKGLVTIKKGKNIIYIYTDQGIAIVDDRGNDQIDMFIIFSIK